MFIGVPGWMFKLWILSSSKLLYERINKSKLSELVITDTIYNNSKSVESDKIRIISIADLLGEAIRRISEESSVSSLFEF